MGPSAVSSSTVRASASGDMPEDPRAGTLQVVSRWRRAIEREPDRGPPLPLVPGSLSNGEYVPPPPTRHQRALREEALRGAEDAARLAGVDRRRFLQSAGGV